MKDLIRHVRTFFVAGFFTILPVFLSFWILSRIFLGLDSILGEIITSYIGFEIPGLGLILGIVFILIIGIISSNVLGRKVTALLEKNMIRVPVFKTIYLPIRDILKNFSDKKSNNFKKAVLVEYPKENVLSMGFITKETIYLGTEAKTVVFIPTTPNPTSGFLVYLKKGDYIELDIPVDVALKSIVSLGSVSPDILEVKSSN